MHLTSLLSTLTQALDILLIPKSLVNYLTEHSRSKSNLSHLTRISDKILISVLAINGNNNL